MSSSGTAGISIAGNTAVLANADLDITTPGRGIKIAGGANSRLFFNVLVGGTCTVLTTAVTANSFIFLSSFGSGVATGALFVSARVANTSFTVQSTSVMDSSVFCYLVMEPG